MPRMKYTAVQLVYRPMYVDVLMTQAFFVYKLKELQKCQRTLFRFQVQTCKDACTGIGPEMEQEFTLGCWEQRY